MSMKHSVDTSRPFSRERWRQETKRLLREGCGLLGISHTQISIACDEDLSTVKAWANETRDHSPPAWAMERLRRRLPTLARFIDAGLAALPDEGSPRASSVEAQAPITVHSMLVASSQLVLVMPDGITIDEALRTLPSMLAAIEHATRLSVQMQQLVGTSDPACEAA